MVKPVYISQAKAAEILQRSRARVSTLVKSGLLRSKEFGGRRLVLELDVLVRKENQDFKSLESNSQAQASADAWEF